MRIDLHVHSTCSDGETAPRDLGRLAARAKLHVFALTDHDTTEGYDEARRAADRVGVRVCPGIEMSSQVEEMDIHILGIGIDPGSSALQEQLAWMRQERRRRVKRICVALAKLGVMLDPEDVLAEARGKSVGRRHVARAMVRKGLVRNLEEAFDRYLSTGKPAHIPSTELSPREAVRMIRRAGGVPVLAHPHFYGDDELVERLLDESGVRGIEAYHRFERPRKYLTYLAMARQRDLIVTGGSDFHGQVDERMGRMGEFLTPPEHWKRIERLVSR